MPQETTGGTTEAEADETRDEATVFETENRVEDWKNWKKKKTKPRKKTEETEGESECIMSTYQI